MPRAPSRQALEQREALRHERREALKVGPARQDMLATASRTTCASYASRAACASRPACPM